MPHFAFPGIVDKRSLIPIPSRLALIRPAITGLLLDMLFGLRQSGVVGAMHALHQFILSGDSSALYGMDTETQKYQCSDCRWKQALCADCNDPAEKLELEYQAHRCEDHGSKAA